MHVRVQTYYWRQYRFGGGADGGMAAIGARRHSRSLARRPPIRGGAYGRGRRAIVLLYKNRTEEWPR